MQIADANETMNLNLVYLQRAMYTAQCSAALLFAVYTV
jgi:hypothetical protein